MPRSSRPTLKWFGDKALDFVLGEVGVRMDRAGAAAVAYARAAVPVRTGMLRASIGYYYIQSSRTLVVYADAPYAKFVEEGTIHMSAQPYLAPAIDAAGRVLGATTVMAFPGMPGR